MCERLLTQPLQAKASIYAVAGKKKLTKAGLVRVNDDYHQIAAATELSGGRQIKSAATAGVSQSRVPRERIDWQPIQRDSSER
jgi:hypothetical protein